MRNCRLSTTCHVTLHVDVFSTFFLEHAFSEQKSDVGVVVVGGGSMF